MSPANRKRVAFLVASYGAGAAHYAQVIHAFGGLDRWRDLGPAVEAFTLVVWIASPLWVLPRLVAVPVYNVLHHHPLGDAELAWNAAEFALLLAIGLWVARRRSAA